MRFSRQLFLLLLLCSFTLSACLGRGGRRGGGDDDDASNDDDSAVDDDDATGDDDDATGDDDDTSGDDDDTSGDDDDDDDDDDGSPSTGAGALPCDGSGRVDLFELWGVSPSSSVTVTVDTISSATTFDPFVAILDGPDANTANQLAYGDDDFTCSFPPPTYQCPEANATSAGGGSYFVFVAVGSPDDCASSIGEYQLEVLANGSPTSDWSLYTDDLTL